ncbi:MAG: hypothetical protein Q4C34_01490 [Bacteroidales bacterium]|nr:hypothetical protein [Bacteroidales bacterium]
MASDLKTPISTHRASVWANDDIYMAMRIIVIASIFCAAVDMAAIAQTETSDSLLCHPSEVLFYDVERGSSGIAAAAFYPAVRYDASPFGVSDYTTLLRPRMFTYAPPAYPGVIFGTDNLTVAGAVVSNGLPGMMNKRTGTMGVSILNGKMNFYVGSIVNKYGFYGGLIRQIGINSRFTYRLSTPCSFTVFAYYYGHNRMPVMPDGHPMPPSMLGYYDVSRFGGYVDYRASDHFGIQVGGRVVERTGVRNRYEVEPIATPYIVVGRGKTRVGIGLPVGQIIYGLFGR